MSVYLHGQTNCDDPGCSPEYNLRAPCWTHILGTVDNNRSRRRANPRGASELRVRASQHLGSAFLGSVALIAVLSVACGESSSTCAERYGELCYGRSSSAFLAVKVDDAIAADLDLDGEAEVVILSRDDRSVSVSWRGGRTETVAVGGRLLHLAAGDIDGDGAIDVIVSADAPPRLIPLHNEGGVLIKGDPVGLDVDPTALATADLNGDGSAELLVGHRGGLRVIDSDLVEREVPAGLTPVAIRAAQLDGDGAIDVAVLDFEGRALELLRGIGAGGLSPLASIPLGQAPEDLDIADINSDGALDIVVRSRLSASLWIIEGDGSGGFHPPWEMEHGTPLAPGRGVIAFPTEGSDLFAVASPSSLMDVTVSDGDAERVGTADLRAYGDARVLGPGFVGLRGALYVYEVVGAPSPLVVDSVPGGSALAAADIDGDGYGDLLTAGPSADDCLLSVRWGGADGLAEETAPIGATPAASRLSGCPLLLELADLNADGELDLFAIGEVDPENRGEVWIEVGLGLGDGTFELGPHLELTASIAAKPALLGTATGALAVLPQGLVENGAALVEVDEAGELSLRSPLAAERTVWSAAVGDVDGDMEGDLVLRTGDVDPQIEVYYGAGLVEGPRYTAAQLGLGAGEDVVVGTHLALGDVDDDGSAEVLLSQHDRAVDVSTLVIVGGLDGAPQVLESADYRADLGQHRSFFGDLDGDGDLDVGLWRYEGLGVIYRGPEGLGDEFGNLLLAGFPDEAASDVDGDGRLDILAMTADTTQVVESRDVSLPSPQGYRLLPGPGFISEYASNGLVHAAHGDANGDGLDDVMIGAHGQLTTAWGDQGEFARATTELLDVGLLRDLISVDLDGDGDVELMVLVSDENTYAIHVLDWSEGGWQRRDTIDGTSTGYALALSAEDLDGDGTIDLAVAAAAEGLLSVHAIYGRVDPEGALLFDRSVTATAASSSLTDPRVLMLSVIRLQGADLDGDGLKELLLSAGPGRTLLLWNDDERRWRPEHLPHSAAWITEVEELVAVQDGVLLRVPVVDRALGRAARIADSRFSTVYAVDDCDGDGRRDLVTASDLYGVSRLWLARGGSYVLAEELRSRGSVGQSLRCADVNDDGIIDIVSARDLSVGVWLSEVSR